MLQALIAGDENPARIADLAQRKLRGKIPELERALQGRLTEHHRFLLRLLWQQLQDQEALLTELDRRIKACTRPFADQRERLAEIPGIQSRVAETLLAEIGPDMKPFPSAAHLSCWAAMCPGNNESAGKKRSGRIPPGNRWLRQALVQAAWAASRTKKSYLAAQFRRLVGRRGEKRALIAVGHSILVIIYHMLSRSQRYQDLGADFLDKLDPQRLIRYHVKRLERLGHTVTLGPAVAA